MVINWDYMFVPNQCDAIARQKRWHSILFHEATDAQAVVVNKMINCDPHSTAYVHCVRLFLAWCRVLWTRQKISKNQEKTKQNTDLPFFHATKRLVYVPVDLQTNMRGLYPWKHKQLHALTIRSIVGKNWRNLTLLTARQSNKHVRGIKIALFMSLEKSYIHIIWPGSLQSGMQKHKSSVFKKPKCALFFLFFFISLSSWQRFC